MGRGRGKRERVRGREREKGEFAREMGKRVKMKLSFIFHSNIVTVEHLAWSDNIKPAFVLWRIGL